MGYEINTTWRELRKDDIVRLNKIIDNKYCQDLEIGRKLNIVKEFERKFSSVIEDINWEVIHKFMKANKWEWAIYDDGEKYRVPTKDEMIQFIHENFFEPALYHIIELKENNYESFSGGIVFKLSYNNEKPYIGIYFDIAHFWEDEF